MIPANITREHITSAIKEIDNGKKIPFEREPHRHQIFYNGKLYPPKFVISLANKYANGGQELDSTEFSGGPESNNFLTSRGFEIRPVGDKPAVGRYDDDILDYLRSNFNADIHKLRRSWLQFSRAGSILYVNGSKKHEKGDEGWYDLEKDIFEDLLNNSHSYYIILLGDVLTTFVIPSNVLKDIFSSQYTIENWIKKPRWMFTVLHGSQGYAIRINGDRKTDFPIDKYLNNWKQIPDLGLSTVSRPKIYVTGYSKVNLDHSLEKGILGWRNQSRLLSRGDYVFVYDTNSHMLQAAFLILGTSQNKDPIWLEELHSKSKTDDIVFPNRWDAKILRDNLQIDLGTIGNFEPFNGNPQNKFIPLIGNNSPTPLSDEKYSKTIQEKQSF